MSFTFFVSVPDHCNDNYYNKKRYKYAKNIIFVGSGTCQRWKFIKDFTIHFSREFKKKNVEIIKQYKTLKNLGLWSSTKLNEKLVPKNVTNMFLSSKLKNNSKLIDSLPLSILRIYNGTLTCGRLPRKMRRFSIQSIFTVNLNYFPKNLTTIHLLGKFNQKLPLLPENLVYLSLGDEYNHEFDSLPNSVKTLKIGNSYNKPFVTLPLSLEDLFLGNNFNQDLGNMPKTLKYLSLGNNFNYEICISENRLEKITIGSAYNKSLSNLKTRMLHLLGSHEYNLSELSNDIENLYLPEYDHSIDALANKSIQHICLGKIFNHNLNNFRNSKCKLHLYTMYSKSLPKNLNVIWQH